MLLTGFTIVFAVLLFLIFIIWAYGRIVSMAVKKSEDKKAAKAEAAAARSESEVKAAPVSQPAPGGVTDEVVAVISAAVYSMYGSSEKVKIKSIKRSSSRSAWANAGVLNNTRPF